MDLVRKIVETVADARGPVDARAFVTDSRDFQEVAYNVEVMEQGGLVSATIARDMGGEVIRCRVDSLTWQGNEFADAVRDPGVWSHVKGAVAKAGGSFTFEILVDLAKKAIASML